MEEKFEIITLLQAKKDLENKLNTLIYGSVEIRDTDDKKYIYVHYREDGVLLTKYVGEYSDDLYNLILNNSIQAKKIKKQLKDISKQLKELNYVETKLSPQVMLNVDFAKRNLVSTIYKQAILEGIATTYADTENIIEGGKINNMKSDDVLKIINLKHAWEFILNENVLLSDTNFALLCQINKFILDGFFYSAGKIRSTPVSIGGTNWIPDFPIESKILKEDLEEIFNSNKDDLDKAIELLLYIMKKQIFIDGNKRTSVIFTNHFLISKGRGIIAIPAELSDEYKKLLIEYYEGTDLDTIKTFLKENCFISLN